MKNKVQKWIDNGKQYEEGIALLPRTGIYENLSRVFTLQGHTISNAKTLEYNLCKLAGIKYNPKAQKKPNAPIKSAVESNKQLQVAINTVKDNPDKLTVLMQTKIRDEFPFLNNKNCPDELKILVADRITAYHDYVKGHKELFDCTPEDQFKTASGIIESYQNNKLIWDELNHYKKHGKLLKKHPIFKRLKRQLEIEALNAIDLAKALRAVNDRIWRNNDEMKKNPDDTKNEDRIARIKEFTLEKEFIENLMSKR